MSGYGILSEGKLLLFCRIFGENWNNTAGRNTRDLSDVFLNKEGKWVEILLDEYVENMAAKGKPEPTTHSNMLIWSRKFFSIRKVEEFRKEISVVTLFFDLFNT